MDIKALMTGKGGKPEDKLWSVVKDSYDIGLELRRPFEKRWLYTLAFISGNQYVSFIESAHQLKQLKKFKGRKWNVDNQVVGRWRRQIADLIKNKPKMSVVPNSTDEEDRKAARIGDKVLGHFWRNADMQSKIQQLGGWLYATGNAFMDDRWDPRLGPTEFDPETGKLMYKGDADVGVWSPLEILVPAAHLGDTSLHRFPWLIKVKWRGLEWIQGRYKRGDEVKGEKAADNLMIANPFAASGSGGDSGRVEGAFLIDYYRQPDRLFPKGLFVTAANGVVLNKQDYPFNHYHMEHFKDIDVPGVFWGKATSQDALGLQRTWNDTLNSIAEFNQAMGKGKWLVPKGSQLEVVPDDVHGERLLYKPVMGYKPEQLTIKSLPPTYTLLLDATAKSFQDLYSQHEVTMGTNKSDLRSGSMVSLLLEQDAHGTIPSHAMFESRLEKVMARVLKRIQDGYDTERMIKVVGKENRFDVMPFRGSDLRNNFDVSVKKQSSLPDSRVAREAVIMERFTQGLYGNPQDPEVRREVMNQLDDAIVEDVYNETRLDEAVAEWENQLLAQGQEVVPNPYDDHIAHIKVLSLFRKSLEYQRLKVENPQQFMAVEQIFMSHEMGHSTFVEQQRQRMLEEQMAGGKA